MRQPPGVPGLQLDAVARRRISQRFRFQAKPLHDAGSVCASLENGEYSVQARGYADVARRIPMESNTIFRLYSLTKPILSVAIGILLDEGKLHLEDPVYKFIPSFAGLRVQSEHGEVEKLQSPMTVMHLLSHTAGFGYGPIFGTPTSRNMQEKYSVLSKRATLGRTDPEHPEAVRTLKEWCDELAKIPLEFHPGSSWLYGYSHDVLGFVVEVVCGQTLDVVLNRRIFEPLGMKDTGFEMFQGQWPRTAGLYQHGAKGLERLDSASMESNEWMFGNTSPILSGGGGVEELAGGLVSTCDDLAILSSLVLHDGEFKSVRLLSRQAVQFLSSDLLATDSARGLVNFGFGPFGFVNTEILKPDLENRFGECGWRSIGGAVWTLNPKNKSFTISFTPVVDGGRESSDWNSNAPNSFDVNFSAEETTASNSEQEVLSDGPVLCRQFRPIEVPDSFFGEGFCHDQCEDFYHSPLKLAAVKGSIRLMKALRRCCDMDEQDSDGCTALTHATYAGHLEVVQWLCTESLVNAILAGPSGNSALHVAAWKGHGEIVRCLLNYGCDRYAYNSKSGTPCHCAAQAGHVEVVHELFVPGSSKEANLTGWSPLHVAALCGHVSLVAYFFNPVTGVVPRDINVVDDDGMSPLHYASLRGMLGVVRLLLEFGADKDAQNRNGNTPIELATETDHLDVAEYTKYLGLIYSLVFLGSTSSVFSFLSGHSKVMSSVSEDQGGTGRQSPPDAVQLDFEDEQKLRSAFQHEESLFRRLHRQVKHNREFARELVLRLVAGSDFFPKLELQERYARACEVSEKIQLIWKEPSNGAVLFLSTRDISDKGYWSLEALDIAAIVNCAAGPASEFSGKDEGRYVSKPEGFPVCSSTNSCWRPGVEGTQEAEKSCGSAVLLATRRRERREDASYLALDLEDSLIKIEGQETEQADDAHRYFEETSAFITSKMEVANSHVMVHCCGGVSRSATMILAFLIAQKGLTLRDAYRFLKLQRGVVAPNGEFMKQLGQWESAKWNGLQTLIRPAGLSHAVRGGFKFVEADATLQI